MFQLKLVNKTKNRVLAEHIPIATTLSQKIVGLLEATTPSALFFETRFGIHTAGMHFAIDCAVMDENFRVRAMRANITPGHFYFWNPKYKNVVELPAGTLAATDTALGDILSLEAAV